MSTPSVFVEYLLIHICYFHFTKARTEPTATIACLPGVIAEPDVETEDATLEDIKKIPQVVIAHPPPPSYVTTHNCPCRHTHPGS